MIRELHEADRQAILAFANLREQENLFAIGSFGHPSPFDDPFKDNRYFGYEENGVLKGIAVCFGKWGSFVVNCPEREGINVLVDGVMERKIHFTSIPVFRRYADPMVAWLKEKYGREPKKVSEETVLLLEKGVFQPMESRAAMAMEKDRDDCARLEKDNPNTPVTNEERACVIPEYTFVIHKDGMLIAKANVHGFSRHFAQIGGVMTHPRYRRQGFGRQCVSALCGHCFAKGVDHIILFTAKTNLPAQNLYKSLGFKPVDEFLIAEYE
ncbi:MAG: GNAT family N-acetyltransferase [Candidatus Peribacteraceae bacterium]|nr:GNAT family N-acetyltransferase [Candidatus Peribacteraceae bacterium]MDD5074302.1 GNAT family N-acetyltransferase [Candidatus Peribacteraceae bacterium]